MNRKEDKRNLSTKTKLANAFKELSKEKQMNKISVNDLIKYCNFNRNTFYYHFIDIYDLMIWIFNEEVKAMTQNFDINNYENFLNNVLDYIEKNKYILNSAYNSFGREQLKKILNPHFYQVLDKLITDRINNLNLVIDNDFKNFLIEFYSGGISELIVKYCNEDRHMDRKKLINYLSSLTDSILFANQKANL